MDPIIVGSKIRKPNPMGIMATIASNKATMPYTRKGMMLDKQPQSSIQVQRTHQKQNQICNPFYVERHLTIHPLNTHGLNPYAFSADARNSA